MKYKIIMQQESLTEADLTEKAKSKIAKVNAILTSNKVGVRAKGGQLTQSATEQVNELDEDICDILYEVIADREEKLEDNKEAEAEAEKQKQAQKQAEAEAEAEKQKQIEAARIASLPKNKRWVVGAFTEDED